MAQGQIKHMFPGGNTPLGFYSFYDYIVSSEAARRIFVLKGGPGVGKSSFMKKIGQELSDKGLDLVFLHCSSDNNSLDGIFVPALKIAMIDGTAPHVVDPKIPGAVDEIIHLGDYWNEEGITEYKEGILKDSREISRYFNRAYKYLKAASAVYEDSAVIYSWAMDKGKLNQITADLLKDIFKDACLGVKEGSQRKLFASAITPDGLKNYLDTILTTEYVYFINGFPGTGTEVLLEKVKTAAVERGLDVELYYCTLNPSKLEHMVIPALGVSLTTTGEYHTPTVRAFETIDLNEYLDKSVISIYKEDISYNKVKFDELLNRAVYQINKAKALHDHMETYYIPNMDFEAVKVCCENTLQRIFDYAGL